MNKGFASILKLVVTSMAIACIVLAMIFFSRDYFPGAKSEWYKNLSGFFLTIASGIVFGVLVKFLYEHRDEQKKRSESVKQLKEDNLQRLRKVFDQVDSSRLLIEAHKSAKTYGEQIRQAIIPSVVTLYDIKRSLVDAGDKLDKEALLDLRVHIHYMIAYLKALTEEFKSTYLDHSRKQAMQESMKEKIRQKFLVEFDIFLAAGLNQKNQAHRLSEFINQKQNSQLLLPNFAWEHIIKLHFLHDFLSDNRESQYTLLFIYHYEESKKILKISNGKYVPVPETEEFKSFHKIRNKLKDRNHKENLVATIMNEEMKFQDHMLTYLNEKIGQAEQQMDLSFLDEHLDDQLEYKRADGTMVNKTMYLSQLENRTYDSMITEVRQIEEKGGYKEVISNVTTSGNNNGIPFNGTFKNVRKWYVNEEGRWKLKYWENEKLNQ
jgi:hypothetical protein